MDMPETGVISARCARKFGLVCIRSFGPQGPAYLSQNVVFRVKVQAGGVPFVFHGVHGLIPGLQHEQHGRGNAGFDPGGNSILRADIKMTSF